MKVEGVLAGLEVAKMVLFGACDKNKVKDDALISFEATNTLFVKGFIMQFFIFRYLLCKTKK